LFALIEKPLINLAERTIPNLLTPTIVGHNVSLAVVILIVLLWNYFINRKWTFRKPKENEGANEPSTEA
jgi:putative flippase GtrA